MSTSLIALAVAAAPFIAQPAGEAAIAPLQDSADEVDGRPDLDASVVPA